MNTVDRPMMFTREAFLAPVDAFWTRVSEYLTRPRYDSIEYVVRMLGDL